MLAAAAAAVLAGCDGPRGGYQSVSSIARAGFARNPWVLQQWRGRDIRLWGYVDHGNLYGDSTARAVLRDWWAGEGPRAGLWRFDLKGRADDAVGHAFAVQVPGGPGSAKLFRRFAADARAGRPTRVFVTGRLHGFDAPTQASVLTGLYLDAGTSGDIRLTPASHRRSR